MKLYTALTVLVFAAACGNSAPGAPSPTTAAAPILVTYAINIPDQITAQQLVTRYPNGVRMSPIQAQREWDYREAYHGSPNVYYGPLGPPAGVYLNAPITTAPPEVAGKNTWMASEWPSDTGQPFGGSSPETLYGWLGRFVYTISGTE